MNGRCAHLRFLKIYVIIYMKEIIGGIVVSIKYKKADIKLLKFILQMNYEELHTSLYNYLKNYYTTVCNTEDYIYAVGNIPIALVAHMDTVWEKPPGYVFYDSDCNVMWSPQGLGADDRAGIFAILKIITHGFRPHIIFTADEEIGGLGAEALAKHPCPFKDLRYIIELDRQGAEDCVFYHCGNEKFKNYVETFDFQRAMGSFSDISFICPKWDVAGVNLSVGYYNEHSPLEHLFLDSLFDTISKVEMMLSEEIADIPSFDFQESKRLPQVFCGGCKTIHNMEECVAIQDKNGVTKYYCEDCLEKMNWCEECGSPYLYDETKHLLYCPECRTKILF